MSSSLFQNNNLSQLMQLANQIQQNPQAVLNDWLANRPGFKEFYEENKNASLEDIAKKYNIPLR